MGLASLQKLHLTDGKFSADILPAHLTNLTLECADLCTSNWTLEDASAAPTESGSNNCVTSLRKLRVRDGHLHGLHDRGLLGCSAVEELQIARCLITAAGWPHPHVDLRAASSLTDCIPIGISVLTSLSSLSLTLTNPAGVDVEPFDLAPLHALPFLQDLIVQSERVGVCLSPQFGTVQQLRSLALSSTQGRNAQDVVHPHVHLNVDWSGLHALRLLTLRNWHFTCTSSIVQLTELRNLDAVEFMNSVPRPVQFEDSIDSFQCFSLMVYRLARCCPHVRLFLDHGMTL